MAPKWHEIEALTDEEIGERFDATVEHASPGIGFWGDMIVLRKNLQAAQALWLTADDTKNLMADMKTLTADLKKSAAESTHRRWRDARPQRRGNSVDEVDPHNDTLDRRAHRGGAHRYCRRCRHRCQRGVARPRAEPPEHAARRPST